MSVCPSGGGHSAGCGSKEHRCSCPRWLSKSAPRLGPDAEVRASQPPAGPRGLSGTAPVTAAAAHQAQNYDEVKAKWGPASRLLWASIEGQGRLKLEGPRIL